ncbi:MAG: TonB-dependent receptor plug domain-containing protein [Chitinophagales bacterium]|nr:TonB-dependent receptor plug domain-containing protein [Chitinophagales bacterium]
MTFHITDVGRLLLLFFSACICLSSTATFTGDSIELKEVIITESKNLNTRARITWDKLENYSGRRLPVLLNDVSGIYLKNYGNGQLTTIAVRGTSSTQTELMWNGIRINSPMLGQSDFALINLGFYDNVAIQYNQLNGAIGSNINLNNVAPGPGAGFQGVIRGGSYGLFDLTMSTFYGNSYLRGTTRFAVLQCENNFPVKKNGSLIRQANAGVYQWALFQQAHLISKKNHQVSLFFWLNNAERQIPPTLQQMLSFARQHDKSFRNLLHWNYEKKGLKLSSKHAYLYEYLRYINPLAQLDNVSFTHVMRNLFQAGYSKGIFNFDASLFADYEYASSDGYRRPHRRILSGMCSKFSFNIQRLTLSGGFRQELIDLKTSPFMPYLSANIYRSWNGHLVTVEATGKRSFRFPTFNDLYWAGSGNPDLKPEDSWNAEAVFKYSYLNIFNLSLSNYYAWIKNNIQWSPEASGIWRPQNLKNVFVRGIEISSKTNISLAKQTTSILYVSYTFTRSTQTSSLIANDGAIGKQLIYVPIHRLSAMAAISYKGFEVSAAVRYVGMRFISSDNTESLPHYTTADLDLSKHLKIDRSTARINFRVNNLANAIYQDVAQRPMPPRNFEFTLFLNI